MQHAGRKTLQRRRITGRHLAQRSRGVTTMEQATNLLEIIHTYVYDPLSVEARGGYCYFLTFTDDLSRYGYIYLMKHKSETFGKFKEFQSEVENHRNKKIKFL